METYTKDSLGILEAASVIVRELASKQQFITADDVQEGLFNLGFFQMEIGNKAGSFFKGSPYVRRIPGLTVRSKRAARKGGLIGVYESLDFTGVRTPQTTFVNRYSAKGATA
jgi:hypothetical protein